MVSDVSKALLGLSDPQVEEDTVLQNVCNYLPVDKEFAPEGIRIIQSNT
jgi:hypothetical protein